jgi:hypothetical protein
MKLLPRLEDDGITKDGVSRGPTLFAIVVFISIAIYNVIELNFIIFVTFRKRRGLYFWSFLVSTWGIALYAVGFLLKQIQIGSLGILYVTLIAIGWCAMVTGQSVVLYSRLHIVLRNEMRMRAVLIMIIVDAIICHVPILVMLYGVNLANPEAFALAYSVYEKVQVTIFFIQELVISGLYIFETSKLMRLEASIRGGESTRRILNHLIYVNVIIVILDITILVLEYAGLYSLQTAYKALVYAVKLKMEFSILNRLVELARGSQNASSFSRSHHETQAGGAVAMDTFDGKKRSTLSKRGDSVGYNAHVHTGKHTGRGHQNPNAVVMTTEVVIRNDAARVDGEDAESIDGKSGTTTDSTLPVPADIRPRGTSASSSEIQFARVHY